MNTAARMDSVGELTSRVGGDDVIDDFRRADGEIDMLIALAQGGGKDSPTASGEIVAGGRGIGEDRVVGDIRGGMTVRTDSSAGAAEVFQPMVLFVICGAEEGMETRPRAP